MDNRVVKAREILENPEFKAALNRVGEKIESQVLQCDPNNKDHTQRIVIAKQILAGIERELCRVIEGWEADKEVEIHLKEVEKQKKPLFRSIVR